MRTPFETTTQPPSTRRRFLQASGALAAAAMLHPLDRGGAVHVASAGPLRVGLIGCGQRGTEAALNAMNAGRDIRLTAMADLFRDRLDASRDRLRAAKPDQCEASEDHCFVGFDAYQRVLESGVDAVLITPASCFIPRLLEAAVAAGKHVFCEKPHGIDVPGVKRVLRACEEAREKGLSVVSGLCWRYDPAVRETMERVHAGQIGEIVAVQETYVTRPYVVREREPGWSEMEYQLRNWYHFNYLSGDQTAQQLIHSLDKASWALGDRSPLQFWGVGGRQVCTDSKYGDQYDHFSVVFEYPGGVRVFGYCRDMPDCWNNTSDVILGTKGRCDLLRNTIEGENPWQYDGERANMYDVEHAALFDAIRTGRPINNGDYMGLSSLLAIAAQAASYTGQLLSWEQLLESERSLTPPDLSFDTEPPVKPGPDGLYPTAMPGAAELARWLTSQ